MKYALIIAGILLNLSILLQAKERVIERPPFLAYSSTSLEVDKIVLTDTATVLHIKAYYQPNNWIKIASGSFLRGNDGELYRLRQGVGITPDQEFWMPESGEADFKLIFPSLSPSVSSVDFSEGDFEGSFQIWGIRLDGKLPDLKIDKSWIASKPTKRAALPEPVLAYGKAVLKGKVADFQKGMPSKIELFNGSPFQGTNSLSSIKIEEDGSFLAELDAVTVTPVVLYYLNTPVTVFLSPSEEIAVLLNPRELTRAQSRLHEKDKPDGKKVYFRGFMEALQQEYAGVGLKHFSINNEQLLSDIAGKSPEEYKAYVLSEVSKLKNAIATSKFSQSCRELLTLNLEFSSVNYLFSAHYNLLEAHIRANKLQGDEARKYFKETEITFPEEYLHVLKEFPGINAPKAFYSNVFGYSVLMLSNKSAEEIGQMLGTDKGVQFDIHPVFRLCNQLLNEFTPLTAEQQQQLPQLASPAYITLLEKENEKVLAQIERNKKKSGFKVNEVGEVRDEDLFASIVSQFRGHTLLVDFWATWCGPCRMANKAMIPMKEELKEQDIVYLYIAGENSPKEMWENLISNIHGEHFRLTQAQWSYLVNAFDIQGVPTYFIIDSGGNITFKTTGFPGKDKIKAELLKAIEKR